MEKSEITRGGSRSTRSEYYDEGNLRLEIIYEEDGINSYYIEYYNSGDLRIKLEGKCVNEYREGLWREYFYNGDLKEEGVYIRGMKEGEWKKYNGDGIYGDRFLASIVPYELGVVTGVLRSYNDQGGLVFECDYVGGFKKGWRKLYDMKSGLLKSLKLVNDAGKDFDSYPIWEANEGVLEVNRRLILLLGKPVWDEMDYIITSYMSCLVEIF